MHGANRNKHLRSLPAAREMHAACTGRLLTTPNHVVWLIRACLEVWLRVTASTCAHAVAAHGDSRRQPQRVRMVRIAAEADARERHPDLRGGVFKGYLPPKIAKGLWSPFIDWYRRSALRTKQASEPRIRLCRGCYRAREGRTDTILDRDPENLSCPWAVTQYARHVLCSSWCRQRSSARAGGRCAPSMQAQALTPVFAELPGAYHGALHVP